MILDMVALMLAFPSSIILWMIVVRMAWGKPPFVMAEKDTGE